MNEFLFERGDATFGVVLDKIFEASGEKKLAADPKKAKKHKKRAGKIFEFQNLFLISF